MQAEALASVIAQQGSRAAQPPPLNLPGRLPGHITHLAPDADPRITRGPDASQAITSRPLPHDSTSHSERRKPGPEQ